MHRATSSGFSVVLAAIGLGLVGPTAAACEAGCWSRYAPVSYGPPVYAGSAVVYAGPPVYVYSYFSPAYGAAAAAYAYGPTYYDSYYTAHTIILRGQRWNYGAAYNASPLDHRGYYGRGFRRGSAHRFYGARHVHFRRPTVRTSGRW
jgi:hypothetical protein